MTTDESDADQPAARIPAGTVKRERATHLIRAFLREHGALSQAIVVVENLGRRGARVVMVGEDGRWGDVMVASVEEGTAAAEAAGVSPSDEWARDMVGKVKTTSREWVAMAQGQVGPVRE